VRAARRFPVLKDERMVTSARTGFLFNQPLNQPLAEVKCRLYRRKAGEEAGFL
jgi:hypothetical protein